MAASGPTYSRRYSFEKYRPRHESKRDDKKARDDAEALLEHLDQKAPEGGYSEHPLFPSVESYCKEVTVNIDWYEERRKKSERDWKDLIFGVLAGGLVAASVSIVVSSWKQSELAITLFLAAFLPALQAIGSAIDYKSRIGGFWKASADLKELLFRLEEAWKGKDLEKDKVVYQVDGTEVARTFEEVLKLDRLAARQICRAERESFFNTFKSPAEVVSKFSESVAALRKPQEPAEKAGKKVDPAAPPTDSEQPSPAPELATRLKASAEGLAQIIQGIEDPTKRDEAISAAVKLVQELSKGPDKPGAH